MLTQTLANFRNVLEVGIDPKFFAYVCKFIVPFSLSLL